MLAHANADAGFQFPVPMPMPMPSPTSHSTPPHLTPHHTTPHRPTPHPTAPHRTRPHHITPFHTTPQHTTSLRITLHTTPGAVNPPGAKRPYQSLTEQLIEPTKRHSTAMPLDFPRLEGPHMSMSPTSFSRPVLLTPHQPAATTSRHLPLPMHDLKMSDPTQKGSPRSPEISLSKEMELPNPDPLSPPASDAMNGLCLGINSDSSAASVASVKESVTSEAASVETKKPAAGALAAGWAPMMEYSSRDADGAELTKGAHVKARASVSPAMPSAMPRHLSPYPWLDPSYGSATLPNRIDPISISIQLPPLPAF